VRGAWWEYLLIFLGSGVICAVLTPLAIRVSVRSGAFNSPDNGKDHGPQSPVPYLGGTAIALSFAGAVVIAVVIDPPTSGLSEVITVLSLAGALALVGLADDLIELRPIWRVLVEIGVACVVWSIGAGVTSTGLSLADFTLTVIWIVGVTNAFNLLDNMDGLASGLCAIASFSYFAIASANGQFLVAALSVGLAGCSLSFLKHNFYPARVYMGDSGSLFIGFLVAYLGLKLRFNGDVWVSALVPVLVCSMAILDTTLVILSRLRSGRSPFQGGQDHVSHRLVLVGLPVPIAVGVIYFGGVSVGVHAFVLSRIDPSSAWILAILIGLTFHIGGLLLLKIPTYPESTKPHYILTKQDEME
jgi:UDP-GlcNAc:undecaprenyl-phosphate GlcNAc-1-phosphate transferase